MNKHKNLLDLSREYLTRGNMNNQTQSGKMWFNGDHMYSYETKIGHLKFNKSIQCEVLLIRSPDGQSTTTKKHINALMRATEGLNIRVVEAS